MSKIIQHKKSRIAGNKPNVTQIDVGEIAINFTDRSVYTKDGDGVIVELARDVWRTSSQPDSAMEGDFWYNTSSNSVSYWDGSSWTAIADSDTLSGYATDEELNAVNEASISRDSDLNAKIDAIEEVNDLTENVTWDTVPDEFISASSVNQHVDLSDINHFTAMYALGVV